MEKLSKEELIGKFSRSDELTEDPNYHFHENWKQIKKTDRKPTATVDPDCLAEAEKRKYDKIERDLFDKAIAALATVCRFQLTPQVAGIYDGVMKQFGYPEATRALQKVFLTRRSNDPFPSVAELISLVDSKISDQSAAQEASDRVWRAISMFGWNNEKPAKMWLGDLGAKVVERMGWDYLTQAESSQGPVIRAQIRETAKSILESERFQSVNKLLGGENAAQIEDHSRG